MAKAAKDSSAEFSGFNEAGVSRHAAGAENAGEYGSDSVYVTASGDCPFGFENVQGQQDGYGGKISGVEVDFMTSGTGESLLRFDDVEIVVESPGHMGNENGNDLFYGSLDGPGTGMETNVYEQFDQGEDGGDQVHEMEWRQSGNHEDRQDYQAELLGSSFQGGAEGLTIEQLNQDVKNSFGIELLPSSERASEGCHVEEDRQASENMVEISGNEMLEFSSRNSSRRGKRRRGKQMPVVRTRVLRSSAAIATPSTFPAITEGKPVVLGVTVDTEKVQDTTEHRKIGRKRGRKKRVDRKSQDEFSRLRQHTRYLLHRMKYERNLIDAYSSEGWRGQSVEKLRPEKELDRAKTDINRFKIKIRTLFLRLDEMSAEGRFPESLFDSEGMIDSEDIYCAKCGSKDVSSSNDIILCDGACERGFHQICLDPPLRTEEIPPGDEGWLCPACDCKDDCINLINDSEGTKYSIKDSWERIFPEAAASANGQDDSLGLPSDDSEDSEFDPDRAADNSSRSEGASTSDESDFSSASEDLGAFVKGAQKVDLGSDDSEDNDYDPEAPDVDTQVNEESSGSDFTSASEDLDTSVLDKRTLSSDGRPTFSFPEPDAGLVESLPVSNRRDVERLDYKKLYDETYEDSTSDSNDDEEWTEVEASTNKKTRSRAASKSSDDGSPVTLNRAINEVRKTRFSPRAKAGESPSVGGATYSHDDMSAESPKPSSSAKRAHKRLGEATTQRLYDSFKEDQYPDKSTREKLAQVLGMTEKQVKKWFENARWSFNHPNSKVRPSGAVKRGCPKLQPNNSVQDEKMAKASRDIVRDNSQSAQDMPDATLQPFVETYEDSTSDSSDNEEWTEMEASTNKKTRSRRAALKSSDGSSPVTPNRAINEVQKTRFSPRAKASEGPSVERATYSHDDMSAESPKPSSSAKRAHERLGEATTLRLYASFKENQYPDKSTRGKLAQELGMTDKQVKKWFGNARWSYNHPNPKARSGVVKRGRPKLRPNNYIQDDKMAKASGDIVCDNSQKAHAMPDATLQPLGETYEDSTSDSRDDEEWTEMEASRNKKTRSRRATSKSSDGGSPVTPNKANNKVRQTRFSPRAKASESPSVGVATYSHVDMNAESPKPSSSAKRAHKRLGESATQTLYASFVENQFPDKSTREKLVQELGMTDKQVKKWFENARWSYNHPNQKARPSGVVKRGRPKLRPNNSVQDNKVAKASGDIHDNSWRAQALPDDMLQPSGSSGSAEAEVYYATGVSPLNSVPPKSGVTEDNLLDQTVVLGRMVSDEVTADESSKVRESPPVRSRRKKKASGA
ncbi:Homeobox protein HAT3.1-like protein [Drosera capensis]